MTLPTIILKQRTRLSSCASWVGQAGIPCLSYSARFLGTPIRDPFLDYKEQKRKEAERRKEQQRRKMNRWRFRTDEEDWFYQWEKQQYIRNAKLGLPPWHRECPPPPPRPRGFWPALRWGFRYYGINWETVPLVLVYAPMFAVLLYF